MPIIESRCTYRYRNGVRLSNIGNTCDEEEENDLPAELKDKENEITGNFDTRQSSGKEAIDS